MSASFTSDQIHQSLHEFRDVFLQLKTEVQRAIVGYDELLTDTLVAIFCQGHILLEGVPGLGKTHLVKVVSKVLGLEPGRVQCTPDLMPADILGTQIVNEDDNGRRVLNFEKGPVFKNIILVDEINRATPKTQAALLEVMQERTVTSSGHTYSLPLPFFVMATQNPMEMEGTYPLPEAQLDRFLFKIRVPFPNQAELVEISRRTTGASEADLQEKLNGTKLMELQQLITHVPVADEISHYAAKLVLASHPDNPVSSEKIRRYVNYGSSPRGMQALIRAGRAHAALAGRTAVSTADIQRVAKVALRHRIILNFEGEAESVQIDALIDDLLKEIPTPATSEA